MLNSNDNTRHVLALSGGKDSSALAIYLHKKIPEMEYVFCDTEKELDETYEYLIKLESYLGKKITFLKYAPGQGFDDILKMKHGFLPSPEFRWCTEYLKLKPYERFLGEKPVVSYVGLRADEPQREGYISKKPNIKTIFPFKEDNIRKEDVERILRDSGLGLPSYYNWRSRSGCYFCFFQQKREWVGLMENHPHLFQEAMRYEKYNQKTGERYTWLQGETLAEFARPERVAQVKANYEKRLTQKTFKSHAFLRETYEEFLDEESQGMCMICQL